MVRVGKLGDRFTLNGEVVPPAKLRFVSAFKLINHIVAWADGGAHGISGEAHWGNARRWVEHNVINLGLQGCRTPLELMTWGPPYFNLGAEAPEPWKGWYNVANTLDLIDLRRGTGSAFSLTGKAKKCIRMLVVLAREMDILIEVPWLWTIKGPTDGYTNDRLGLDTDPRKRFSSNVATQGGVGIWNEHYMSERGIAAYLHKLETQGDGEGRHRVDPGGLNLLHDMKNERTAHTDDRETVKAGKTNTWDQRQLQNVARRWHDRDYPDSIISISESGRSYGAPLASQHGSRGYDYATPHPPRGGDKWVNAIWPFRQAMPNELIFVNESQMGWTAEQRRQWVRLIPKWEGLGVTNLEAWFRMHEQHEKANGYTCFHTLRGMDGGWPDTPQTAVEEGIREFTGASSPGPPPTEPGKLRYERVLRLAYEQILGREPDQQGLEDWNAAMSNGTTEAEMRESMIRGKEYEEKNPI